jgi:Family of unknown function (DUF5719)
MRRIALLALAGFLGVMGLMQVAPPPTTLPDWGSVDALDPGIGASASPSVWYCPWVEAGDVVDSDVMVATVPDVDVDLTLLHPLANEDPASITTSIVGPGASVVATGDVLRVGESPGIVEISNGPAAAVALQYADGFVAGDECVVSVPKIWYLTGGSTRTGTITSIRLFNPFADNAEVTISAYSEFGLDLVAELDGFDVEGRSWTTIDLEPYLPFRDELTFTVTTNTGLVIPALIRTDDHGQGVWPGTAPSETWDFPIVTVGDLEPFIAVMSSGDEDVVVSVDIIGEDGAIRNAREVTLDSSSPALIPLSDLAAPPFGVRVRATAPIGASAIALVPTETADEEEPPPGDATTTTAPGGETTTTEPGTGFVKGLGGTVGAARPSSEWIVPIDTIPGSFTTMWIMNTGTEPATISYAALGEVEYATAETIEVPAESTLGIPVDVGIGYYGFRVMSDTPVSVAWEIVGDRGVALVSGIPSQ